MEVEKYIIEIQEKKRKEIIGTKIIETMKEVVIWAFENRQQLGINSHLQAIKIISNALAYALNAKNDIDENEKQQVKMIIDKLDEGLFNIAMWVVVNKDRLWINNKEEIPQIITEALNYVIQKMEKEEL
jgi:hypothetical protein